MFIMLSMIVSACGLTELVGIVPARLRRTEEPGDEEQGVPGQGGGHEPRLDEHHQEEAGGPEGVDQVPGIQPVESQHSGAR